MVTENKDGKMKPKRHVFQTFSTRSVLLQHGQGDIRAHSARLKETPSKPQNTPNKMLRGVTVSTQTEVGMLKGKTFKNVKTQTENISAQDQSNINVCIEKVKISLPLKLL